MNPEHRLNGTLKVHLICWLVFIAYEILVAGMISGQYANMVYYISFYGLNISLFYLHAHVVLPKSFAKGKKTIWRLPFLFSIEITAYVGITVLLSYGLEVLHLRKSPLQLDSRFFITTIWRSGLFLMFSSGYYFLRTYLQRAKNEMARALAMEQLNAKLIRTERDFLRAQINPHLLFNMLNFVRYASKRKPEQVDDAIVGLSELMHFAMEKTANGLIPIKQELAQIQNIINLNQMRFGGKLAISFDAELEDDEAQLIPIILLTLVENVFKHGDLTDANDPAEIIFRGDNESFVFTTRNLKGGGNEYHPSTGNGLINIQSRLHDTYGENAQLKYGTHGKYYLTELNIRFTPKD